MPIHKTSGGKWQWGRHGAKYATKEGAEKQAAAAHAHGYRGDSQDDSIHEYMRCATLGDFAGMRRALDKNK